MENGQSGIANYSNNLCYSHSTFQTDFPTMPKYVRNVPNNGLPSVNTIACVKKVLEWVKSVVISWK